MQQFHPNCPCLFCPLALVRTATYFYHKTVFSSHHQISTHAEKFPLKPLSFKSGHRYIPIFPRHRISQNFASALYNNRTKSHCRKENVQQVTSCIGSQNAQIMLIHRRLPVNQGSFCSPPPTCSKVAGARDGPLAISVPGNIFPVKQRKSKFKASFPPSIMMYRDAKSTHNENKWLHYFHSSLFLSYPLQSGIFV